MFVVQIKIKFGWKLYFSMFTTILKRLALLRTQLYSFSHIVRSHTIRALNIHPSKIPVNTTILLGVIVFIKKVAFFIQHFPFEFIALASVDYLMPLSSTKFLLQFASLSLLRCFTDIFTLRSALLLRWSFQNVAAVSWLENSFICIDLGLLRSHTVARSSLPNSNLHFWVFSTLLIAVLMYYFITRSFFLICHLLELLSQL